MNAHLAQSWKIETLAQALALIASLKVALVKEKIRADLAEARVAELTAMLHKLQRSYFGQSSERRNTGGGKPNSPKNDQASKPMPPMREQTRKAGNDDTTEEERRKKTQAKRQENRDRKKKLPIIDIVADVVTEDKICDGCNDTFCPLGDGDISYTTEWVPGHFVCHRHVRRKYVCRCGEKLVVASNPDKVLEKVTYGPGFHAYTVISKCLDSMPLHGIAKSMRRQGVEIRSSTVGDIIHRSANVLEPIYNLFLTEIAKGRHLNADEKTIQMQARDKTKRCYMWVFVTETCLVYLFSTSRSGAVPQNILHGTSGTLQVDGYTGYNKIPLPDGRTRAGYWAHVRRYFYDATETAPLEADVMLAMILQMYRVEYLAAERN